MPLPLPSVRSNSLTRLVRANPAAVEKIPSREMKAITRGSKISCTSFGTSISTPANEEVENEHTLEVWAALAVRSSTTTLTFTISITGSVVLVEPKLGKEDRNTGGFFHNT